MYPESLGELEELRAAFFSSQEHTRCDSCPDPAEIWSAVHAEGTAKKRREIVRHMRSCPSCAADWRIAAQDMTRLPERRGRVALWAALAATVLVVIGLSFLGLRDSSLDVPPPVWRSPRVTGVRPLPSEGASLPRDSFLLRWEPVGEDARYLVELSTVDLTELFQSRDLIAPECLIPERALSSVEDGGTVLWRVEAQLPDGRVVSSEAFMNLVSGPSSATSSTHTTE